MELCACTDLEYFHEKGLISVVDHMVVILLFCSVGSPNLSPSPSHPPQSVHFAGSDCYYIILDLRYIIERDHAGTGTMVGNPLPPPLNHACCSPEIHTQCALVYYLNQYMWMPAGGRGWISYCSL